MRELLIEDMYLISEIIDKMGFKMPKRQKVTKEYTEAEAEADWGNEIIRLIASKLYLAKDVVDKLLANVLEKDIEEIRKMKLKETMGTITSILGIEGVKDFFK